VKTNTDTLIKALRILANDIQSDDGVANATIVEAADRLHELRRHTLDQGLTIATLEEVVTDDNRSNKAKVLAFSYVLRKEKP
jgi:uncharacterized protein (UPF0147 family)